MTIKKLASVLVFAMVISVGGGYFWLSSGAATGDPVEFEVPAGASTTEIANLLEDQGVISSALAFRIAVKVKGLDGTIEAGKHDLREGMSAFAAAEALGGIAFKESTRVTIPEGLTVDQISAKLGSKSHLDSTELLRIATSGEIRSDVLPSEVLTLEGLLFPETYEISKGDQPKAVLERMVGTFARALATVDLTRATAANLTPYDIVIIASLIEREAKIDEDRDKVAAVIWNRLRRGMRLQIDITALYGVEHKVPTRKDLQRESPYNTYLNDGLPPTPIASPGLAALQAAANPADIAAIYYVVIDPSGRHGFADNSDEFQRLRRMCPRANCG